MYIELYEYIEGDDNAETGEYYGYVSQEEDDVYIDVDNDKMAEQIEEIFSEPFTYTARNMDEEFECEPYTEEFFRRVINILPDYNIRGILKEDDEKDRTPRRTVVEPDADEDEDMDMMEDMEVDEMEMDDDYDEDMDEEEEEEEEEEEDEDDRW